MPTERAHVGSNLRDDDRGDTVSVGESPGAQTAGCDLADFLGGDGGSFSDRSGVELQEVVPVELTGRERV